MIAFYFILCIALGCFAGFMGLYFKRMSNSVSLAAKLAPYLVFVSVVLIVAQSIWLITRHLDISESIKGLATFVMLCSVVPGVLLARKLLK
jgi:hypothetical protein